MTIGPVATLVYAQDADAYDAWMRADAAVDSAGP